MATTAQLRAAAPAACSAPARLAHDPCHPRDAWAARTRTATALRAE